MFRNEKKFLGGNCRGERLFRFAPIYFPENTSLYLCVVCTIFWKNRPHFCASLQNEKSLQKPLAICEKMVYTIVNGTAHRPKKKKRGFTQ